MGANAQMRVGHAATGVLGLVGAAPLTGGAVTANKVPMGTVERNTLSALLYAKATTGSLTITPKWQVSQDGTNWYDAAPANNPANVVLAVLVVGFGEGQVCQVGGDCGVPKPQRRK